MVWFTMDLPGGRNGPVRTAGCWLGAMNKVDTQLAMKALSDAFERRGRPSGLMFH